MVKVTMLGHKEDLKWRNKRKGFGGRSSYTHRF